MTGRNRLWWLIFWGVHCSKSKHCDRIWKNFNVKINILHKIMCVKIILLHLHIIMCIDYESRTQILTTNGLHIQGRRPDRVYDNCRIWCNYKSSHSNIYCRSTTSTSWIFQIPLHFKLIDYETCCLILQSIPFQWFTINREPTHPIGRICKQE